jgi:hypothetical protein
VTSELAALPERKQKQRKKASAIAGVIFSSAGKAAAPRVNEVGRAGMATTPQIDLHPRSSASV